MPNSDRRSTKVRKTKVVIFDEENLARTYHPSDKTYGFMEIDEPKTPYPSKEKAVNSKELKKKLEQLKKLDQVSSISLIPGPNDDSASTYREQRKKDFEERRKKNYAGEFLKAKEALNKLKDEEDVNGSQPESAQKKKGK